MRVPTMRNGMPDPRGQATSMPTTEVTPSSPLVYPYHPTMPCVTSCHAIHHPSPHPAFLPSSPPFSSSPIPFHLLNSILSAYVQPHDGSTSTNVKTTVQTGSARVRILIY
jgi:hypothetical protein